MEVGTLAGAQAVVPRREQREPVAARLPGSIKWHSCVVGEWCVRACVHA